MGMRRGVWNTESFNKAAATKTGRYGARPATVVKDGMSNSEHHMVSRGDVGPDESIPEAVSEHRREELIRATDTRQGKNGPSPILVYSNSYRRTQELKESYGFVKSANVSSSEGMRFGGSGGTVRQAPEVYSPLFQIANLQLPRDRITMNAWNRNFYDTHPLVHNCINLHSTYPISKINIKCKDRKVEQFFKDMANEIDLVNILQSVALELWKMGECFPYAELDENTGTWKNIIIQNPDYIHIKTAVLSGDSIISMRPDAALQRLVQSSNPADIQLRKQIDEEILYHVKKGNNIPLDNFHVSHLFMKSSPYDIHGTSPIVTIYKDLMLYDKLRECYSQDTEILTENGFMSGLDLAKVYKNVSPTSLPPKIACFNSETEMVEYNSPLNTHISHYKGAMYHFNGKKVDVMVTPNHRMWVSRKITNSWSNWEFKLAKDMSPGTMYRFRSTAHWHGEDLETVNVCETQIPIDLYLEFLGYVISEGCVQENRSISLSQCKVSCNYNSMRNTIEKFAKCFESTCSHKIRNKGSGFSKAIKGRKLWEGIIYNKKIANFFFNSIGSYGKCTSHFKRIPRFVMNLPTKRLHILLNALVAGDGSIQENKNGKGYKYFSISKDLCNDISELVLKCGYTPNLYSCENGQGKEYWVVSWTENSRGRFPRVYGNSNHGRADIDQVDYDDLVWCFEVPTGLFITRRNGKLTIQGNSKFSQADNLVNPITLIKIGGTGEGQYRPTDDDLEKWRQIFESAQYDKDFKIITHAGVEVQRVGAAGSIIDINTDMTFILDNILHGLLVPKAVITQEGASFNSATVGLEILKQRYESFRNMMAGWLTKKIFAPISEIQEFYEYKDGDKKLIVPEVEWNRMILFDMDNYINVLNGLVGQMAVSKTTLFRSLGLNIEEERRLIKEETINQAIITKEYEIMQGLTLGGLRALKADEDIIEPTEAPLPGAPGAAEEAGMPGVGVPSLTPPLPAGGMPPMPPMPGAGGLPGPPGIGKPPAGLGTPPTPGIGTPPTGGTPTGP